MTGIQQIIDFNGLEKFISQQNLWDPAINIDSSYVDFHEESLTKWKKHISSNVKEKKRTNCFLYFIWKTDVM